MSLPPAVPSVDTNGLFISRVGGQATIYGITTTEGIDGRRIWAGGDIGSVSSVAAAGLASRGLDCGCIADCDGDELLTIFDFLCFQNNFAASSPAADCDGDGLLTIFDFLCFQNSFASGCP